MKRCLLRLALLLVALLVVLSTGPRSLATATTERPQSVPPTNKAANPQPVSPTYSIWEVEYAFLPIFPFSALVGGTRNNWGNVSAPFNITVVKGLGHTIVFDSGFENPNWARKFGIQVHERPADAVRRVGVDPATVDTLIIGHFHWDHADGMRGFPNAKIYVQRAEVDGWRAIRELGPDFGWLTQFQEPDDLVQLMEAQAQGRLVLLDGDASVLPGVDVFLAQDTHTPGSQWALVQTDQGPMALTSDDVYMYTNIETMAPIGWMTGSATNNLLMMAKVKQAVGGDLNHVVPGHDHAVYANHRAWAWPNGLRAAEIALSNGDQTMVAAGAQPIPSGQAFINPPTMPQPQCPPTLTYSMDGRPPSANPCPNAQ